MQLEKRWWARLSKAKSDRLEQLFRNKELSAKFDALLQIPGLWGGMRIGSIGKILGPEFDEVNVVYMTIYLSTPLTGYI